LGYGWPFWQAYASNVLLSAALAVLFRYADFIGVLGGTEWHLGWIVGVGMIGSLTMRMFIGSCIDRYGARIIWLSSLALFAAVCFAHLWIDSYAGVAIYLLRIVFCCAWASVYVASLTFVSKQAAPNRMAELYGMIGTATFVGYFAGTLLGDLLLSFGAIDRASVNLLFDAAGVLGLAAIPPAWAATRGEAPSHAVAGRSAWQVVRRHHPLATFFIGAVMGMLVGTPNAFLRAYVGQLGISRIGLFFSVCAVTTVVVRVPTRQLPERFGNKAIILLGAAGMAVSQLAFLLVGTEWQLVLPAIIFGGSQAIMFPAVTAAGSAAFPADSRGLATTLILGASDVGLLVGSPLTGMILSQSETFGLPPYPTLFIALAVAMIGAGIVFAVANRSVASGRK
jgi:MFS family permease